MGTLLRAARWLLIALLLAGCHPGHNQSALHPAGPGAAQVAALWWFLLALCTAIFVVVMTMTALAIWRPGKDTAPPLGVRFIVFWGIIVSSIILVVLLLMGLTAKVTLSPEGKEFLTVRVIGHQFWWDVHYPEHDITVANEVHIPVGVPVKLELKAADVIHSFWAPNLAGKMDLLPEHFNYMWIQADVPGVFRGQCAEYCGVQHANMAFEVVALPNEEFQKWVTERQKPIPEPETESQQRGQKVFLQAGCSACHAIRGVSIPEEIGPDLTHLGSRRTIAAGILPNNRGNLGGWIANPQAIKPGNKMPRTYVPSEDMRALLDYLMSLK